MTGSFLMVVFNIFDQKSNVFFFLIPESKRPGMFNLAKMDQKKMIILGVVVVIAVVALVLYIRHRRQAEAKKKEEEKIKLASKAAEEAILKKINEMPEAPSDEEILDAVKIAFDAAFNDTKLDYIQQTRLAQQIIEKVRERMARGTDVPITEEEIEYMAKQAFGEDAEWFGVAFFNNCYKAAYNALH
jgi:uncharacterized membrane protein